MDSGLLVMPRRAEGREMRGPPRLHEAGTEGSWEAPSVIVTTLGTPSCPCPAALNGFMHPTRF